MTPGTPVRINYYGDIKHNAIGTVAGRREVGSAIEVTVDLHRPIRVSGHKPLRRVYVFERFLQELDELPTPPAEVESEPEPKRQFAGESTRPAPHDLVPVAQMAKRLDVHIETAKRIVRRGDLAGWRVGRNWAVSESELEEFAMTYVNRSGPKPKGEPM